MSTLIKTKIPALRRFFVSHPFWQQRQEMQAAFENVLGERSLFRPSPDTRPSIDVSEIDAEIQVETDPPGFKPEEVDIEVNDNDLTISGFHIEEQVEKKDNGRKDDRVERHTGSFSRTVLHPCAVKQDAIDAQLKEGVLTVRLPKSEESCRHNFTVKG